MNVEKWTLWHAYLMLVGVVLSYLASTISAVLILGSLSFLGYLFTQFRHVRHLRPYGGYANWVTTTRCFGLIITFFFEPKLGDLQLLSILVLWLLLDGLDGYLARKYNASSAFGARLDMETDAYFVLCLSLLLSLKNSSISWIILLGLWRYCYVVLLQLSKVKTQPEPTSYFKKASTVFTIVALLVPLVFFNQFIDYLVLFSVATTTLSFSHSLYFQFTGKWIPIP